MKLPKSIMLLLLYIIYNNKLLERTPKSILGRLNSNIITDISFKKYRNASCFVENEYIAIDIIAATTAEKK